jgi:hypothetical protein
LRVRIRLHRLRLRHQIRLLPVVIEHNEPNLKIIVRIPDQDYEMTYVLTTDGSENLNRMPSHTVFHKSRTHWEGDKLVTAFQLMIKEKVLIEGRKVRFRADDGKTLILEQHLEDSKSKTEARQAMTGKA